MDITWYNCGMQPFCHVRFSEGIYIYNYIIWQWVRPRSSAGCSPPDHPPHHHAGRGPILMHKLVCKRNHPTSSNKIPNHPTSSKNTSIIRIYKIYKPEQTNSHTPTSLSFIKGPPTSAFRMVTAPGRARDLQLQRSLELLRQGCAVATRRTFLRASASHRGLGLGDWKWHLPSTSTFATFFLLITFYQLAYFIHVLSCLIVSSHSLWWACCRLLSYIIWLMRDACFFSSNRSKPCFSISVGLVYLQAVLFGEHIPRVFFPLVFSLA